MTELAIYDMDRTITRTGTFTPFLIHAAMRLAPWRLIFAPLVIVVMLAYVVKLIERRTLKEINQTLLIGGKLPLVRIRPITESYADFVMKTNVHQGALDQIAEDRAAGRRIVMATASARLYVTAIADRLGFDDLIATNSIYGIDDIVTAKIDGENCYGPAKLRMIEAWMAAQGLSRADCRIRFYSDHASDAPVLAWSDVPFAVNAHAKLRRMAQSRGWTIVDWGL
ncbi:HAD family hydrolase [Sphingomonas montanisoli]|uniref:HAD-IB family phosphatase n=1 Tax=Sphingomonas montanisoli TaxID=2606412 RepID=A0A5D9C4B0_9SPHN|nr:HAD-IB family phosphatase [Sphingomonas montanisoli]TZG26594.1 HAD-IB family phosphatase [Sphingomonas montanisoli]